MTAAVDSSDYTKAAKALRAAGDKELSAELTTSLRTIAKPYGQYVLLRGAAALPKKGGLSERVAFSSVTTQVTPLRAQITLKSRQGYDLPGLDDGLIRHPVFANKAKWVEQSIRKNAFSTPFNEGKEQMRPLLMAAAQRVFDKIQGETE